MVGYDYLQSAGEVFNILVLSLKTVSNHLQT